MAEDLTAKILADYPQYAWLLHDPEVGPLLLDAVNPEHPYDEATFQNKLATTTWWRTTSAAQRSWQTLYNTDQASYNRQLLQRREEIRNYAASLGLEIPEQKLWDATEYSLSHGLAVQSAELRGMLSWFSPTGAPSMIPDLKGLSRQYMVDLSDGDYGWWSREIAAGRQTQQSFTAKLMKDAAGRWSMYADEIASGITPEQLFGQQRNAIARELEMDPTQIDLLHDARWSKVLGVAQTDGKQRPMTYNEAVMLARSQPEWGKTRGAQTQGADLVTSLLSTFGAIRTGG